MEKAEAIAILRAQAPAVKALGATELYMFGSTLNGRPTDQSDIDLFVDYDREGRFSLVELVGIKQLLERHLGVPVDLTTRDSLDPLLSEQIEFSAERIF